MAGDDVMQPGQTIALRPGVTLTVNLHRGSAPPVVFVHGGLGNRLNWRSQFEFACRQGWETLAYDLAGHGTSSGYRKYSIGRHCRDLTRLLKRLSVAAPILCCHSYGVPIGLEWAHRNPTAGLILIAGGSHDLDPWWEQPLMTAMATGGRQLMAIPAVQRLAQSLISSQQSPVMRRYFEENPIPTELAPYQALKIFWAYDLFAKTGIDTLRQIPTLVITGGCDPAFSFRMGENLVAHFQQGQHVHLAEAGHVMMAEFPEIVNARISSWIAARGRC